MDGDAVVHVVTNLGAVIGGGYYIRWFLSRGFTQIDKRMDKLDKTAGLLVKETTCVERREVYLKEAAGFKNALKDTMSVTGCISKNERCSKGVCKKIETISTEQLELWSVINHHGHKGLDGDDNNVTRV